MCVCVCVTICLLFILVDYLKRFIELLLGGTLNLDVQVNVNVQGRVARIFEKGVLKRGGIRGKICDRKPRPLIMTS